MALTNEAAAGQAPRKPLASTGSAALTRNVEIPSGCHALGEPALRLTRAGDVIESIEVTCGCGRRIKLICDYADARPGNSSLGGC